MLVKKTIIRIFKTLMLPIAVYIIFLVLAPDRFGSLATMNIILIQSILPSVIGWGLVFGMVAGLIDLSVGSRIIIAGMIGGILAVQYGLGLLGLVIGGIVVGIILGILTGALYTLLKIPSIVLAIGLLMVLEIVGAKFFGGIAGFVLLPSDLTILGFSPYILIIGAISFILCYILCYHTKFSYNFKAVGSDEILARNMGINTKRTKFLTFVFCGIFMGIASVLQISYASTIGSKVGIESLWMVFQPLMSVLIGIELQAICNLAVGVFIAAFTLNIIFTGLICMGLPDTMQNITTGVFLLIVMGISSNREELQRFMKKIQPFLRKQKHRSIEIK